MSNAVVVIPSDATDPVVAADPRGDIRTGIIIAALFFVLFVGWAAFFRLDSAAYAHGALVVAGQRQAVQHRDGGVVGEIRVHEGERVKRGELLIQLAAPEVQAQERALQSQAIRLLAQRARLRAEQDGAANLTSPPEFADLGEGDKAEGARALREQQGELNDRQAVLSAQSDAMRERVGQAGDQGRGYLDQTASTDEQIRLIDEQLTALEPLTEKGFVSKTRVRELQRARAQLQGQRGQYSASVAQSQGSANESKINILEAQRSFRERTAADLREVENGLGELIPKLKAAREQLARTEIRAPATGAVVGLSVFTPGGVISPGQKLMDIVPESEPLLIQAKIAPDDADDLVTGQRTLIKFPGLHERTLPSLEGTLTRISADSFTDEKSGASYFTGEISVGRDQLALIDQVRGKDFELRAGMPVEILIPLRKRTALDYAFEPLLGSFWASFREH